MRSKYFYGKLKLMESGPFGNWVRALSVGTRILIPLAGLICSALLCGQPVLTSAEQTGPLPTKINTKDGLNYSWIPPGKCLMGCSANDTECFDWEESRKLVEIRTGFWIGQTEVTQAAYQRVIGNNPSRYQGLSRPVDQIGWSEARKYCVAAGGRLPTETEWEYAPRAGNQFPRYGTLDSIAWYDGNSADQTHDVALKAPNAFGLYDTLGNLWEWVADDYRDGKKVLRGSSFFNLARDTRVSNRLWATPETAHRDMGVRCVIDFWR